MNYNGINTNIKQLECFDKVAFQTKNEIFLKAAMLSWFKSKCQKPYLSTKTFLFFSFLLQYLDLEAQSCSTSSQAPSASSIPSKALTHLSQQLRLRKGVETISQGLLWLTWPLCSPLNILCSHPSNKTWAPAVSLAQCEPERLEPLSSGSSLQIIRADDIVLYIKPFMPASKWGRKTAVMTMIYHCALLIKPPLLIKILLLIH